MALPQQSRGIHNTAVTALRDTLHCSNSREGSAALQQREKTYATITAERYTHATTIAERHTLHCNNNREGYTTLL